MNGSESTGCSTSGSPHEGGDAFYWVPDAVVEQWGEVLDIVVPQSQRCNCFTRTYSRYTKARCSWPIPCHSLALSCSVLLLKVVTTLPSTWLDLSNFFRSVLHIGKGQEHLNQVILKSHMPLHVPL